MFNGSDNFSNITAINATFACIWRGTSRQWLNINAFGLVPPLLTILCNALNLVVFQAWHKKAPYVLFHILLAVSSLLYGVFTILVPIGRLIRPRQPLQWMQASIV
ncbi:hypothetical protein BV898_14262 [Hypsibius exemplaris]|uniref:Uncharacterized protein n=1 Tax=Hypsibius exemplaris TaxID=2072580 RepID=A0A1W0W8H3_HYPEX|nr:hypothetical protein BV898_14262 [Hypsibius exemplaris]